MVAKDKGHASPPDWLRDVVLAVAMLAVGIAAFAPGFSAPFFFDDITSIPENPHLRSLWPLKGALAAPPNTTVSGRPVVSLTLAVNYAVGGLDVRGYHACNLALHLATAWLLFLIARRTMASWLTGPDSRDAGFLVAASIALIWMVHPLQTESVTYTIQRTGLLMGFFYLATLYCSVRSWDGSRPVVWSIGAAICCALGMASKESMVTAPVAVLLYDYVFVSARPADVRRHAGLYVLLFATWTVLAVIMASTPRGATVGFGTDTSAVAYLLTQAGVICHYLRLCIWPFGLVVTYADWPVADGLADVAVPGLLLLVLLAGTLFTLWRRSLLGFLGGWFFLTLAPTSSFVPIVTEVAAERRMYLPLIGVVGLAVWVGAKLLGGWANRAHWQPQTLRRVAWGSSVVVVALLAVATAQRNAVYESEITIWQDVVTKRPGIVVARINLANRLFDADRVDESIPHYREVVRQQPDARNLVNLGNALVRRRMYDAAADAYSRAASMQPAEGSHQLLLARVRAQQGNHREAEAAYRKATVLQPESALAWLALADFLLDRGAFAEAEQAYRVATKLESTSAGAFRNLGIALGMQQRLPEAIVALQEAVRLNPDDTNARAALRQMEADLRRTRN